MRAALVDYLPWVIGVTHTIQILFALRRTQLAWVVGLFSQLLWVIYIVTAPMWGLLPFNVALWFLYLRGLTPWGSRATW